MKAPLIGWAVGIALSALLGFTAFRDSTSNSDFASYGCVENTNCHEKAQ